MIGTKWLSLDEFKKLTGFDNTKTYQLNRDKYLPIYRRRLNTSEIESFTPEQRERYSNRVLGMAAKQMLASSGVPEYEIPAGTEWQDEDQYWRYELYYPDGPDDLDDLMFLQADIDALSKKGETELSDGDEHVEPFYFYIDYKHLVFSAKLGIKRIPIMVGFRHIQTIIENAGKGILCGVLHDTDIFIDSEEGSIDPETYQEFTNVSVDKEDSLPKARSASLGIVKSDQQMIDKDRLFAVNKRIKELEVQRDKTTDRHKQEGIQHTIDQARKYVAQCTHEGKSKLFRDSQTEKARIAVRRAVERALKRLHKEAPESEKYLNKTTIICSDRCTYKGTSVPWITQKPK